MWAVFFLFPKNHRRSADDVSFKFFKKIKWRCPPTRLFFLFVMIMNVIIVEPFGWISLPPRRYWRGSKWGTNAFISLVIMLSDPAGPSAPAPSSSCAFYFSGSPPSHRLQRAAEILKRKKPHGVEEKVLIKMFLSRLQRCVDGYSFFFFFCSIHKEPDGRWKNSSNSHHCRLPSNGADLNADVSM